MPNYKDANNQLHFIDSVEFEHLLPAGYIPITDAQAEAIRNPPKTIDQVIAEMKIDVQSILDETAKKRGYDSGVSCASYANSTNPVFKSDANAFIAWRDAVWAACHANIMNISPGTTWADVQAILPAAPW